MAFSLGYNLFKNLLSLINLNNDDWNIGLIIINTKILNLIAWKIRKRIKKVDDIIKIIS